jgi:hypothetical protein
MISKKKIRELIYREVISGKIVAVYDCTSISNAKAKSVIKSFNPNKHLRKRGLELYAKIITRYE